MLTDLKDWLQSEHLEELVNSAHSDDQHIGVVITRQVFKSESTSA